MLERDARKLSSRLNSIFESLYTVTNEAGKPVYVDFQKLPSRTGTDYYKYVSRPISLHTIGRNIKKNAYKSAQEFVSDLAQVTWNARHYNEPGLEIHSNANVLDTFIKDQAIPRLAQDPKLATGSTLYYPDLGPLGEYGDVKFDREGATASPFNDDDDHVRPYLATPKVEGGVRRGRPPIIDKPYELRIKLILKQLKKVRDPGDELRILTTHFERLPDKSLPGYYEMISNLISLHEIRTKVRLRKYTNVQGFLDDMSLMINNAKLYWASDPGMASDIALFEKEAQRVIEADMARPDKDFVIATAQGAEGALKVPLDLVTVRGHTFKVGDWVLIRNPNDPNKPICGQIFRLWSSDGVHYTNVCWYIRPEQTLHRVDRLFYVNEVCKTGEYRDHLADDIIGPSYVIFLTHYQKGDIPPNMLPPGTEWFICEFRYNANSFAFNRIRTWKACLPDEIRHIDQPIVPINEPRKLVKYELPLKHLLLPNAHEDMLIAAPTAGPHPNGPPVNGAVYLRPPYYDDELGQCVTSPNVAPAPQLDDPQTGRKAYIFTPVSQLKLVTGSGIYLSSGTRVVSANYTPGQPEEPESLRQPYLAPSYRPPIKSYGREFSPSVRDPTPYLAAAYTQTLSYSGVLPGGVVLYVGKPDEDDEVDLTEVSAQLITSGGDMVWFRAPPTLCSGQPQVSHSARYLAWKARL